MDLTAGYHEDTLEIVPIIRMNRGKSRIRPCAAVLILIFSLANPGIASVQEQDSTFFGKKIRSIAFSADRPLDRSHYDPYLGVKPGDLLTRTGVKGAIQSLYDSGRFAQIIAEAVPEDDGVCLRFNLRHNYYFNRFSISGNVPLKGRALWEWVSLPTGQRFTEEKLEESRRLVQAFVNERGYYLAQVKTRTIRDEKNRQVDVVFDVLPGKLAMIRSIEIAGVPTQQLDELSDKFGYRKGKQFDRSRLNNRLESLRKYFIKKGYLAAVAQVSETFEPESNRVALALKVTNFGRVRVVVEGFRIDKNQIRRLLPVLTGEGVDQEILEEGANNLREYLENKGYPEADIKISEKIEDSGIRVLRYTIVPNQKFTVAYVRFKDNRAFTEKELLAAVAIQPSSFLQKSAYSVKRLDDDVASIQALYESRGYLEAKIIPLVELLKDGKKLGITFLCNDGRLARTRSLTFAGNTALPSTYLRMKVQLAAGGPYSPSLAERDRQSLLGAYNDAGYLQAKVTVRAGNPDEANSYPVEFQIEEGMLSMVDRIIVLGNDRTRSSLIQKRIKLRENAPLSLGQLLQTQQALYGLGIFDQVRVAPQNPQSTTSYQDIVVRLQEAKRFTVRPAIGYQEHEKLRGTIEFSDINILGSGRRGDIRLRGSSIEQQAIFSLQQPQFRALRVDSYFTTSILRKEDVSFSSRRFNVSYQFSHPFSNHSWGMFRYNFKNVRLYNLQVSDVEREDEPRNLSTFSIGYVNDSRDNYLDPEKGFFSSTDFGVTTKLLGSNNYISFFTQNSYYHNLPKSFMTAFSLRVGAAHPFGGDTALPISERFFAGGGSSLRGFDTDKAGPLDLTKNPPLPKGGNALVIGSVELRIPLLRFVHLAGFYDTGNVFGTLSDIRFADFSHTVGGGLRIKTPFGPLRADYGYNANLPLELRQKGLKRGHLFITVGPPF